MTAWLYKIIAAVDFLLGFLAEEAFGDLLAEKQKVATLEVSWGKEETKLTQAAETAGKEAEILAKEADALAAEATRIVPVTPVTEDDLKSLAQDLDRLVDS